MPVALAHHTEPRCAGGAEVTLCVEVSREASTWSANATLEREGGGLDAGADGDGVLENVYFIFEGVTGADSAPLRRLVTFLAALVDCRLEGALVSLDRLLAGQQYRS